MPTNLVEQMIPPCRWQCVAVFRGRRMVGSIGMPFMSYQISTEDALHATPDAS